MSKDYESMKYYSGKVKFQNKYFPFKGEGVLNYYGAPSRVEINTEGQPLFSGYLGEKIGVAKKLSGKKIKDTKDRYSIVLSTSGRYEQYYDIYFKAILKFEVKGLEFEYSPNPKDLYPYRRRWHQHQRIEFSPFSNLLRYYGRLEWLHIHSRGYRDYISRVHISVHPND